MRVIIADDSVLLREGVARLLTDTGADVIGKVGDASELLASMSAADPLPDVCVIDVRMPPTFLDEGLRAALVIRQRWPAVGVLVLSQYVEERYAAELIRQSTDGVGYLLKDRVADVDDFADAVRTVSDGGTVIDPEVVQQILARAPRSDPLDSLTPREREVLTAMAEGKSNAGIAAALVVGQAAVEKHIGNIFAKLGLLGDSADHRRVMAVLRYLGAIR
ncbi:DNA-binding response regulator [Rhodococcus sp. 06-412-2C]|uniref:response regulator transcription factor n=1 Tax=unclassified Rhodococcus (in: high G+C Gram-positive bacteria) TaxID=192944 RepID=UPI000B9A4EDD|nr:MULTISPECIES: response regulator transcription factor [unclassified Rhodococcus (in: high G+C Gram-positive bacteria)]OZC88655.1 DNA-binding response regulator [Rhodococcus sp. 06-412-2C]OZD03020.1 DNA-binding response regulator [Rhodococcus sp. 06-412-2B]